MVASQISHFQDFDSLESDDCNESTEDLEAWLNVMVEILLWMRSKLLLGTRLVMLSRIILLLVGQVAVVLDKLFEVLVGASSVLGSVKARGSNWLSTGTLTSNLAYLLVSSSSSGS